MDVLKWAKKFQKPLNIWAARTVVRSRCFVHFAKTQEFHTTTLKKIAAPYSGGRAIKCGALYAAEMVLKNKFGDDTNLVDELDKKFQEKVGAINCRDIRSKNLRPCIGCVEDSATILEKIIAAN